MEKKLTTYQMAVTALMAAVMCVLGPLTVPIGAVPISLANFVICLTAWLLGPKFGTLSVAVYLCIGLIGVPVFSGYGAGLAKLAGPTGGYLVGYLLLALIGLFTVLGWIVGLVRSALDDSGLRKAYRDRLYGMVMLDPVAFDDVNSVDPAYSSRPPSGHRLSGAEQRRQP